MRPTTPDNDVIIDHFYPCIKYKIPADPKLDGTDYFIVAETMHSKLSDLTLAWAEYNCSLTFTCEKNQRAFYKLMKDC